MIERTYALCEFDSRCCNICNAYYPRGCRMVAVSILLQMAMLINIRKVHMQVINKVQPSFRGPKAVTVAMLLNLKW